MSHSFVRMMVLAGAVVLALASGNAAIGSPLYTLTDLGIDQIPGSPYVLGTSYVGFNSAGAVAPTSQPPGWTLQAGEYSALNVYDTDKDIYYTKIHVNNGPPATIPNISYINSTFIYALNTSGATVGVTWGGGGARGPSAGDYAFVYSPSGGSHLLPTLLGSNGAALAINDLGQIVGESGYFVNGHNTTDHAFLSDGVNAVDLNTLIASGSGLLLVRATGINDQGQIVGQAFDSAGRTHDFLLTPIPTPAPEPSVLSMAVLLGLGYVVRQRVVGRRRRV